MHTTFTILGSLGYIGSNIAARLSETPGMVVNMDSAPLPNGNLGHILFCVGVTTDYASRLHDTMRAHVCKVMEVLRFREFESFTYLSSTRVYERADSGDELASLTTDPASLADYYKISKIAGEAVCLTDPRSTVRVARLSNVIGFEQPPMTFVPSLINDALLRGRIVLNTALDSAKDYVGLEDVIRALTLIALGGKERVYNVSSGLQTTHREIVECISHTLRSTYEVKPDGERSTFPETASNRLRVEFGFEPQSVLDELPALCRRYAATTNCRLKTLQ